jgi:hypothetical protein
MTDANVLSLAQRTSDMYYITAVAMTWELTQMPYCTDASDDPSSYDIGDIDLDLLALKWTNDLGPQEFKGTLDTLHLIRLLWRAQAVINDWLDIAKVMDMSIDSIPQPKVIWEHV